MLTSFVCWYIILVENILLLRTLRGVDFDFNNTKPADTSGQHDLIVYNVPLVKTQMKKIIVTAKTLYSHPKNVSKIYAALHTDLAW